MDEKNPKRPVMLVCLHTLAICYALYMFYSILSGYLQGGEAAPNLPTVIIGGIVLLGGSLLLGFFTWKIWKKSKEE